MRSLQIATIRGIPIKIHWLFFLLPLIYAVGAGSLAGAARAVILILLLFACVVLHELGHSIAAQQYGIHVKEIMLWPLGGVAQLTDMPRKPLQEFVVAVAGPLMNVLIIIALAAIGKLWSLSTVDIPSLTGQSILSAGLDLIGELLLMNVFLVLFNLIPAFPMDGGRILRSVLNNFVAFDRATLISMWVGRAFAAGFVIWGLLSMNFVLALVGVFVFFSGSSEYNMIRREVMLESLRVSDIVQPVAFIHSFISLGQIAAAEGSYVQPLYAVADGDHLQGIVTPEAIQTGILTYGPATPVARVAQPVPATVRPETPLSDLYNQMVETRTPAMLVVEHDRPIGIVTIQALEQALAQAR